jgi:predicted nucleic acid-binding protein
MAAPTAGSLGIVLDSSILVGDRDLQIAVTALSLDFDLAMFNDDEFRRVTGLRLADGSEYIGA